MMLWLLVVASAYSVFATHSDRLPDVMWSSCRKNITIDKNFRLAHFADRGTWAYRKVTRVFRTDPMAMMLYTTQPTGCPGQYNITIYYEHKNGSTGIYTHETEEDPYGKGPVLLRDMSFDPVIFLTNTKQLFSVFRHRFANRINISFDIVIDKGGALSNNTFEAGFVGLEPFTLQIYFIKYGKSFAYYYICNEKANDNGIDFRFILANNHLSQKDENDIKKIEEKYKFRGELIDMPRSKGDSCH